MLILISAATVVFLAVVPAMAIPPPGALEKDNWQAGEILIGEVVGIEDAPDKWQQEVNYPGRTKPMYFTLKVEHVVKSAMEVDRGDTLKIYFIYHPPEPKKEEIYMGPMPVRVEKGKLVIVYAEPTSLGKDVLSPRMSGHSVFSLGLPLPPKEPAGSPVRRIKK